MMQVSVHNYHITFNFDMFMMDEKMRALLGAHTGHVSFSTPQHQQPMRSTQHLPTHKYYPIDHFSQ